MNQIHIGWRLGAISPPAFQRYQYERHVKALTAQDNVRFIASRGKSSQQPKHGDDSYNDGSGPGGAHIAGVNCLTISNNESNTLVSGGADGTIHLWDLATGSAMSSASRVYHPAATLQRNTPQAHTHAITSLSIYPFDPTPQVILSTSHDRSFKLTAITPSALQPVHSIPFQATIYSHSLSPHPTSQGLTALATSSPHVPLVDLRTTRPTHSLPDHNAAIYTVAFSPTKDYLLATGATDGRILLFDIRRASPAFASLDHDDPIGILGDPPSTGHHARTPMLDWTARAHTGAVTGLVFTSDGHHLVSAGHDQRIRLWDVAVTGRTELVHFGPRVRNERLGHLAPLLTPSVCGLPGKEMLLWPNDDGKGDIYLYSLREGNMLAILRTPGVRSQLPGTSGRRSGTFTSAGRINQIVWRWNAVGGAAAGVEMYSAHGDGRIVCWAGAPAEDEEVDFRPEDEMGLERVEDKKRKRQVAGLGELVQGLTSLGAGGGLKRRAVE